MSHSQRSRAQFTPLRALLCAGSSLSMLALSQGAFAQNSSDNEVVTTGIRQVIQDSIALKRQATTVVDGLSADEIGDLPALSIAEALEQIASVGSQREGSGATEVSIRGLGPFLGSTVINGREATNGSGDRSVNFSQFPSELFNKIEVYKTQEASFIEGGVAGQIALSTLKPLEYGKRRVQLQAKGSISPDNLDINDAQRQFGYRLTGSYVDQWESNSIGEFGISIGGQIQRRPNPEQESRTGGPQACVTLGFDGSSCNGGSPNITADDINPETGRRFGLGDDFLLTSSSASFRQNNTDDSRDSIFGAAQWRPNDSLDINFDVQYADRTFEEFRNDLIIDRNDIEEVGGDSLPIAGFDTTFTNTGAFRTATTTGDVQAISQFSEREEEYIGFGGNVSYDVTDRLNLSIDGSYSDTSRRENQIQARVASQAELVGVEIFADGSQGPQFTLLDFDVNDPSLFVNDNPEVREDLNQFRNNTIWAIRGDAEYAVDNSIISAFKAGARYSVLEYDQLPRVRNELEFDDGAADFAEFTTEINGVAVEDFGSTSNLGPLAAAACANSDFPEADFLDGEINGNLFTNIDSNGDVIAAGTGNTFLTFDGLCLGETLLGRELTIPSASDATNENLVESVDIEEETIALYGQVEFDTQFDGLPIRGNVGLRYVDTTLTSQGFRSELSVDIDPDTGLVTGLNTGGDTGNVLESVETEFSYDEFLPSLNVVLDVSDDVLVRGGVFRAISRVDPSDLGNGREFDLDNTNDDEGVTLDNFVEGVEAFGNPFRDPFTSWNYDVAAEWYPNEDSIVAVGAYYKVFSGGFANAVQDETFVVNGESFVTPVSQVITSDDKNTIFGIETSIAHAFTYLPGLLSGTGFNVSYNYADSDFEIEDSNFGEEFIFDESGNIEEVRGGFVDPAGLAGLSRHTANGRVYWNVGKATLTGIGKYRSQFFQPFVSDGGDLRFIDGAFVLDARLSYKINKQFKVSVEGTNILNTAREQLRSSTDNFGEINVFGPRVFLGITAKF